jgi:3-hydroxyisobutyrate dehydrogenase
VERTVTPTVGWIGLGAMGYPMAGRATSRFRTLVWNRTGSVAERHADEYGSVSVSLEQAVAADVVLSCLSDTAAVARIVDATASALVPGTIWVDCTSGAPAASREVAQRLAGLGVDYLDAPVSGMVRGARAGTLTMLIGGDPAVLARVQTVLRTMAEKIVHVGPVGTGHLAKAANNSLFAISFWAAAEALGGLAAAGVPVPAALEAINASSGRSYLTERFLAECVLTEPPAPGYRLGQSTIDIGLLIDALATSGAGRPRLLAAVHSWYAEVAARVGEDADAARAFATIMPSPASEMPAPDHSAGGEVST